MPWYKATQTGFRDGTRVRPGGRVFSEKKLEPTPSWLELDKEHKEPPPPKRKPVVSKGPAVAEGAEGTAGLPTTGKSATELDVI